MFDIGFTELSLVALVALVVIGPERLPGVARTLGHLFGRLQRYVSDVKSDISREIELDELRKFKNQFEEAAESVQQSVRGEMADAEAAISELAAEMESADPASELASATESFSDESDTKTGDGDHAAMLTSEPTAPVQEGESAVRAEAVSDGASRAGLGHNSTP
ncbi:MAG: twin arginine-targeting protein translocase TatB [Betaproteobacteria bacterium RIFCSPLOWO2_02_FULL_63_19]|nr:MAG: twin arginine-targeting protein translocase TatB [Betaproteobacteria bacterium RIFCSPLOWO2_02_FULL_63_19]